MRRLRGVALLAGVLLSVGRPARAQDSQFGVRGLGTPGRWESVRARTTGGAFAAFDAASALVEAALTDVRSLTATAIGTSSYRSVSSPGGSATLQNGRFPLFTVAGAVSGRLILGAGFSTYLDNSYEVVTRDSVVLRGAMVPYTDNVARDGGISDMRVAAAARFGPTLALGLGLHVITGSARVSATRTFGDSTVYATVRDSQSVRQTGFGISASALLSPSPAIAIIAFGRSDGHLNTKIDDVAVGESELPNMVGGAVRITLSPLARVAGSVAWRSWSRAGPDAYNTINWSAGLELGAGRNALRVGGRGGQMPFGPGGSAPSEWGVAAGWGRVFGDGHGVLDFGLERLVRDGGGLHEGVWTVLVGLYNPAMNVFFHTFGCRANQYDSELVRQAFADRGAAVVEDPAAADVAVVNSCTVTQESEAKLRRFVRRLARRSSGRGQPLDTVVMGCAAARDDGSLRALPSVRAVVGGADPAAVLSAAGLAAPRVDPVLRRFGANARGWLKIQDGCDEHCSFCATTLARGANRSRSIPELVEEARALSHHHSELVLTGVHIGTFGQDRSFAENDNAHPPVQPRAGARGQSSLGELLEALVTAVPDVRFRLSSIEATEVDDRIARLLIAEPRRLAPYLHAPLQSGSNRVLRRMGRHWYTSESYRARLEWLAARLPVFGLGADVIAGFPGETDADHQATLDLIHALPFTSLHVFPYSPRPDTAATRLRDAVPPGAIRMRAAELRTRGEAKAQAYRARRVGATADGVASGRIAGRVDVLTEDYLSVYLPVEQWDGTPRFPVTVV